MLKRILILIIDVMIITATISYVFGDGSDEFRKRIGFQPRFYRDGVYQDGRNVCICIAIADRYDANPATNDYYHLERYEVRNINNKDRKINEERLLENHQFDLDNAIASVTINYKNTLSKNKKTRVNLFVVTDICLENEDKKYEYRFGDEDEWYGYILDKHKIDYNKNNNRCFNYIKEMPFEEICSEIDLSGFYEWAEMEWNGGLYRKGEKEEEEEDQACGCALGAFDPSALLFLGMLLIGLIALSIGRRRKT